jgi:hypothetical protein
MKGSLGLFFDKAAMKVLLLDWLFSPDYLAINLNRCIKQSRCSAAAFLLI